MDHIYPINAGAPLATWVPLVKGNPDTGEIVEDDLPFDPNYPDSPNYVDYRVAINRANAIRIQQFQNNLL